MSESKKKLLELEKEGKYLFHGSPYKLEELEPRQPYTFDKKSQDMVKDGEPSVVATAFVDAAIFRAIINNENIKINHESSIRYDSDNGLEFGFSIGVAEEVKNKSGYVYVVDKKDFSRYYSDMEWRSNHPIKPLFSLAIKFEDLSEKIEII